MNIAKNLRRLRMDMGITQEELAQQLNVTAQAVSNWERDECYPDITMLPGLANYFQVTVDELLGIQEIRGKLWGVYAQANELQVARKYAEAIAVYDEALKQFPTDMGINAARAEARAMAGDGIDDAIAAQEQLIASAVNEKRKASASAALCYLYRERGMDEKAMILAQGRPHLRESRELLVASLMEKPAREAYIREQIPMMLNDMLFAIEGEDLEGALRRIVMGVYDGVLAPDVALEKIGAWICRGDL